MDELMEDIVKKREITYKEKTLPVVNQINGKFPMEGQEWYRVSENQVLEKGKKGKFRMIYPLSIDGQKIKRNWFYGMNLWMLLLVIAFLLLMYNYHINLQECTELLTQYNLQ